MSTTRKSRSLGGRPKIPDHLRRKTINATVAPATREYLERIGDGSSSRGARIVLDWAASQNTEIPRQ